MKKILENKISVLGICLVLVLGVSGCASKMPKTSGFLSSYKNFKESDALKGVFVKKNSVKSIGDYDKFLIDDIVVYFIDEGWKKKVDPMKLGVNAKKLGELTQYFHDQIVSSLEAKNLKVVEAPGDGVLRIRIALTDVDRNIPILNVYGYQTLIGLGIGGAAMEGEALDSVSGEQILSVVTRKKGGVLPDRDGRNFTKMDDTKSYAKDAASNKLDSLTYWNTIKQILDVWADNFAKAVAKAHEK